MYYVADLCLIYAQNIIVQQKKSQNQLKAAFSIQID